MNTFLRNHYRRYSVLAAFVLVSGALQAAADEADEILAGADARIEQHRKADATLVLKTEAGTLPEGNDVNIWQIRHAFLFGSCAQNAFNAWIRSGRFQPEPGVLDAYKNQFAELLNFCTVRVYWASYERTRGEPQHDVAQENIDWAREHGMAVKGHVLVWNQYGQPEWLDGADTETVLREQQARITRELKRFPGLMWDVVNETADYGREDARERGPELTAAMDELGVGEFVRRMYTTAREADPTAVLLTNDYITDERYEENGIRPLINEDGEDLFDAIGIQSHMHGGVWSTEKIWDVCERFAKYGKPLHFTEVTVLSGDPAMRPERGNWRETWPSSPDYEAKQAKEVERIYTVLFSHPAVEAITWWDFSDSMAWQRAPAGLLRADMTPKPAYEKLKSLIKDRWWTETKTAVGAEGKARFRGFLGDYEVTVTTPAGETFQGKFTLTKPGGEIEVLLR